MSLDRGVCRAVPRAHRCSLPGPGVPASLQNKRFCVRSQFLGCVWGQATAARLGASCLTVSALPQVYRGRLKSGEAVAVKVQRPFILETVTVDLYVIRGIFTFLRRFKGLHTDFVALLDEWAMRFFEELDYVHEVRRCCEAGCHRICWYAACQAVLLADTLVLTAVLHDRGRTETALRPA